MRGGLDQNPLYSCMKFSNNKNFHKMCGENMDSHKWLWQICTYRHIREGNMISTSDYIQKQLKMNLRYSG